MCVKIERHAIYVCVQPATSIDFVFNGFSPSHDERDMMYIVHSSHLISVSGTLFFRSVHTQKYLAAKRPPPGYYSELNVSTNQYETGISARTSSARLPAIDIGEYICSCRRETNSTN